jgi:hypothetical protein
VNWRARLKDAVGPKWTTRLRCMVNGRPLPLWGNLRRTRPFSEFFGFDRGTPVDRYYLNAFLDQHRDLITGDVLEIQSPGFTRRFGQRLRATDSVDIVAQMNPTYVCDLAKSQGIIPSDRYDCFLLPNTLSVLKNLDGCLEQALRVVRPGGVILASTAGMVPLTPDVEEYWRMSEHGWREVFARVWPSCDVSVEAHGNCLTAVAACYGLALEELTEEELRVRDPRFPVLVTVRCTKPD